MINVLLVDDHDLVRIAIRGLLNKSNDIKIIGEAKSGEEALLLAKQLQPDIIIMDLKMPGIGGFEASQRLLNIDQNIKIIALTSYEEECHIPQRIIRIGVMGYITKTANEVELTTAIRNVYHGHTYIMPTIAQKMAIGQTTHNNQSPFVKLSRREMQIVLMIVQGYCVKGIASDLFLSPKTINTYRYRTFEKLNINNNVELLRLAYNYGILDAAPTTSISE